MTTPSAAPYPVPQQAEAEQQDRLAWEAERIAQADAELESGLYIDAVEMRAWIDSIGTDRELPPPPTRRR
jgi:predicted transcriptional regulator